MAHWRIITVIGDSKAVFQDSYANLTDFRYDGNDARVKKTQVIGGVDDGDPVTMVMGVNQNGIEFALGYGLLDSPTTGADNILIVKVAFSSTQLRLNWRSIIAGSLHQQWIDKVFEARQWCIAQGDTCELNSTVILLGVNDLPDGSADLEDEATQFLENTFRDVPDMHVVWCITGTDIVKVGATTEEIAVGRAGLFAACAKFPNVDTLDETGTEYIDDVHHSSDGMLGVGGLGDQALATLVANGLTTDAFAGLNRMSRAFRTQLAAQAFANDAHTALGSRDENPANGGFASRGSAARDPWPLTPRSTVEKHPYHDTWYVFVDNAMIAESSLNTDSDLRPVDDTWVSLTSVLTKPQNRWAPEDLTPGASAVWADSGAEGADLTSGFAGDPAFGFTLDGRNTLNPNAAQAMENATTSMTGATDREVWVVARSDDHTTQLLFDAVGGTDRNSFFVNTGDDLNINAGATLALTDGLLGKEHRPFIMRIVYEVDGTASVYVVDSEANAIASPVLTGAAGTATWAGITLGASNTGSSAWKGGVAEMLRYDDIQSDAEAKSIASYLLERYPSCAKFNSTEVSLMTLGDSLTAGLSATDYAYRDALRKLFEGAGDVSESEALVFRGSNEDATGCVVDHDGVSGNTIAQVTARVAAAMAANPPDVIVLLAGTNDCRNNGTTYDSVTTPAAYATLLSTIAASDDTVPVVCCLLPPLTNSTHNANVDDFNAELVATVIPGATNPITTVDLNSIVATGDLADGVHPTSTAHETIIAPAIAAGIRAAVGS